MKDDPTPHLSYVIILVRNSKPPCKRDYMVNFGQTWSEPYEKKRPRSEWTEGFNRGDYGWIVLDKSNIL